MKIAHGLVLACLMTVLFSTEVHAGKPLPPLVVPCTGTGEVGYASQENIPIIKYDDGTHVLFADARGNTIAHAIHMPSQTDSRGTFAVFAFEGNVDYKPGDDFCEMGMPTIVP